MILEIAIQVSLRDPRQRREPRKIILDLRRPPPAKHIVEIFDRVAHGAGCGAGAAATLGDRIAEGSNMLALSHFL